MTIASQCPHSKTSNGSASAKPSSMASQSKARSSPKAKPISRQAITPKASGNPEDQPKFAPPNCSIGLKSKIVSPNSSTKLKTRSQQSAHTTSKLSQNEWHWPHASLKKTAIHQHFTALKKLSQKSAASSSKTST